MLIPQQAIIDDMVSTNQSLQSKLVEFSRRYDLHRSGLKYREEEDKKEIVELQDELILLETG
jgi:hypothetical protein